LRKQNHWSLLGLEPTKDEGAIKAAWLKRLPDFHPEDDPEGFRRLREAYEAAVAEVTAPDAAWEEDAAADLTPSGLIVRSFKDICDDFRKRVDVAEWQAVLDREQCGQLDMQAEIGEKLLILMMEGFYLPQKIWRLLDGFFGWSGQFDLLQQRFPPEYIDYVRNSIEFEENIRSDFFDLTNEHNLTFINLYYELNNALNERDFETAEARIQEIKELGITHIDFRILEIRYYYFRKRTEQALALVESLLSDYPEDIRAAVVAGQSKVQGKDPAGALSCFRNILAQEPEHYSARVGVTTALFELGEYEQAKDQALNLLMEYYYDDFVNSIFHESCERLIPIYEARLVEEPGHQDTIYRLASCYYNEEEMEKCLCLIQSLKPEAPYVAKHYELLFDAILHEEKDYLKRGDELYDYLMKWEAAESDRQRLRFLPQKLHILNRTEEALDKAILFLTEFPDDPELLMTQARILRDLKRLDEAWKVVSAGLQIERNHPALLSEMAYIAKEEGNRGEAVQFAEQAIEVSPYLFDMHVMILSLYYEGEMYEEVLKAAAYAEECGMEDPVFDQYKAAARLGLNQDVEKSVEILLVSLKEHGDAQPALNALGDFYLCDEKYEEAEDAFTRLLAIEERGHFYLSRGWARFSLGKAEEAKEDFRQSIRMDPDHPYAHYCLGFAYHMEDLLPEAIAELEQSHALDPSHQLTWIVLVKALSESGEINRALKIADEGIAHFAERDSDFVRDLRETKMDVLHHDERFDEVLALAPLVMNENGESKEASVYRYLGNALYEAGRDDEAEEAFQNGLLLDSEDDSLRLEYGDFLLYGQNNPEAAVEQYAVVFGKRPTITSGLRLAKTLVALGENVLSKKHYRTMRKAMEEEMDVTSPCELCSLGECHFGLKNYKLATQYLFAAIEQAANHPACHRHYCHEAAFLLAKIFLLKGNHEEAVAYYQRAIETVSLRMYREAADTFGL
jgi:tetratricopeptide (TPR) repeat protein